MKDSPYLGRIVVIVSPIFLGVGAWLATWIADSLPGNPEVNPEDIQFVILTAFVAIASLAYKWLDNRGKWEREEAANQAIATELTTATAKPGVVR